MKKMKLSIHRFEETEMGTLVVNLEVKNKNIKQQANETANSMRVIEDSVSKTMSSLEKLPVRGSASIKTLKTSIKSLLDLSKELDKKIGSLGRQKYVTSTFKTNKEKLKNEDILKRTKIGFTGGESSDRNQLLKDVSYLYSRIQEQQKLINNEHNNRIKLVDRELSDARKKLDIEEKAKQVAEKTAQKIAIRQEKEEARLRAQEVTEIAKNNFQQQYTDLGSDELTQSFREQYNELMKLLTPEQQDIVVKKLMKQENDKLTNSIVSQIQALKEEATNSDKSTSKLQLLKQAMNSLDSVTNSVKGKIKSFINELKSIAVTWRILSGVFRQIINVFANLYDSAAGYEEALNLYTVALGDFAEAGSKWANRISMALYLDPKQVMQYTGAFYNLVQGLGVGSDAAYKMATNLTQLSYDMSSYLNIDVESAHNKIQSAITGQSRAVASAGIAMQQASLQELAYSLGIKKTVSEMTQAEKTYLRYIQIMRSTTNMQSDLARTIITPENALRVIKTQFELLGRAIGQVFIPIVLTVIPYIMVLTEKLKELATWLAGLTGYKIADIDYSSLTTADTYLEGLGNTATNTAGKVKKAAASISRSLAPFDELNVVESQGGGGSAGTGAGVPGLGSIGDLEKYVDGYDMLAGLTDTFNKRLEVAREKFEKILNAAKAIGMVLVGFKIAKSTINNLLKVADIFEKINKLKNVLKPLEEALSASKLGSASKNLSNISTTLGSIGGIILYLYLQFKSVNSETDRFTEAVKSGNWGEYFKINSLGELIDKVRTAVLLFQGGWIPVIVEAAGKLGKFNDSINTLKDNFGKAKDYIRDDVLKPIGDEFKRIYDENIKPAIDDLKYMYEEYIKPDLSELINSLKKLGEFISEICIKTEIFKGLFEILTSSLKSGFVNLLKNEFIGALTLVKIKINEVTEKIETITSVFKGVVKIIKGIADGDWKTVWSGIKETAIAAFKGMVKPMASHAVTVLTLAQTMINGFVAVMQGLVDNLNKIKIDIPSWVPGYGGKSFNVNIPRPKKVTFADTATKVLLRLKTGIDFVPKDYFGPVYLDYGERVLTKEENKEYMKGNTNYLADLSRNSVSTNNKQLINDLAKTIVDIINTSEANRQPDITQVYIGNEKVYEGQGEYQNRQSERYGTAYIKI